MDILISVRQGDPLAMVLFIIYIEPLLLMIRKSTGGLSVLGLSGDRGYEPRELYSGKGEVCATQTDVDYVDDVNTVLGDPQDMVIIDQIFVKFERMSGAILNRSEKTKLLGLGHFKGRQQWPLDWIKVEKSLESDIFPHTRRLLTLIGLRLTRNLPRVSIAGTPGSSTLSSSESMF